MDPVKHPDVAHKPATRIPEWEVPASQKHRGGPTLPHVPRPHIEWPRHSSSGGAGRGRVSEKFNTVFPRHKRYLGLSRRIFLVCLAALLVILIAVVLGLSIGLSRKRGAQNLPLPTNTDVHTGDWTYYEPGLGACGITSSADEDIVSISHFLWDAASTSSNPNDNPYCGKKLRARRFNEALGEERSVDLTVVDRCTGCQPTDIDTSLSAFEKLAPMELGRVTVSWAWLPESVD